MINLSNPWIITVLIYLAAVLFWAIINGLFFLLYLESKKNPFFTLAFVSGKIIAPIIYIIVWLFLIGVTLYLFESGHWIWGIIVGLISLLTGSQLAVFIFSGFQAVTMGFGTCLAKIHGDEPFMNRLDLELRIRGF